ncbi:MAG: YceI family protein [Planctomycetales bacterium]|nr:YceI family protein [Planctomycetales bacterium]MBN8625408.1 YceI family protein [Planctomycetota bacterium]
MWSGVATRSRLFWIALLVCVVSATRAVAQEPPPPGTVNVAHSRVFVFVGKKGAGHEHGVEGRLTAGELRFDGPQAGGKLLFDMKSFAADTDAARRFFQMPGKTDADTQSQVTANMHGAAVLDVAKHPSAEFVVRAVRALPPRQGVAGNLFQLDGEFTLHGVKKPLGMTIVVDSVNGWVHAYGDFTMKQTDFSIKPFSKFLGAVGVTDELRVYGDLYLQP